MGPPLAQAGPLGRFTDAAEVMAIYGVSRQRVLGSGTDPALLRSAPALLRRTGSEASSQTSEAIQQDARPNSSPILGILGLPGQQRSVPQRSASESASPAESPFPSSQSHRDSGGPGRPQDFGGAGSGPNSALPSPVGSGSAADSGLRPLSEGAISQRQSAARVRVSMAGTHAGGNIAEARRRSVRAGRMSMHGRKANHRSTSSDKDACPIVGGGDSDSSSERNSGATRSRDRTGGSNRRSGAVLRRSRNPFIEYEDREQRLTQERKWLQEDNQYMQERTADLRQGTVQKNMLCAERAPIDLHDARVFFGAYSMKLRGIRKMKEELQQRSRERAAAEIQSRGKKRHGGRRISDDRGVSGKGSMGDPTNHVRHLQKQLIESGRPLEAPRHAVRPDDPSMKRLQQRRAKMPMRTKTPGVGPLLDGTFAKQ